MVAMLVVLLGIELGPRLRTSIRWLVLVHNMDISCIDCAYAENERNKHNSSQAKSQY
jgi:hypothetical protein